MNLVATGASTPSVSLTWTSLSVDHFEIWRNGAFLATSPVASYTDSSVSANSVYVYRVLAVDSGNNDSPFTNADLATTMLFTNDPILANTTLIRAAHVTELRQAVNSLRAITALAPFTFADPSLLNVPIRAVHIEQLRTALAQGLSALGFSSPAFTDPILTTNVTKMRASHVQELRTAMK
jgi:hypothetical protein